MLLINKVDKKYDEEKEEEVKLEDPIKRWKRLLGNKDPAEAKAQEPDSLRAKYGVDAIKNGFYCSDDPKSANKERGKERRKNRTLIDMCSIDVFKFLIPEKVPEFHYERNKITLENLLKFIYPPNLEHSNTTGRLDVYALYGPVIHLCYDIFRLCATTLSTAASATNASK